MKARRTTSFLCEIFDFNVQAAGKGKGMSERERRQQMNHSRRVDPRNVANLKVPKEDHWQLCNQTRLPRTADLSSEPYSKLYCGHIHKPYFSSSFNVVDTVRYGEQRLPAVLCYCT